MTNLEGNDRSREDGAAVRLARWILATERWFETLWGKVVARVVSGLACAASLLLLASGVAAESPRTPYRVRWEWSFAAMLGGTLLFLVLWALYDIGEHRGWQKITRPAFVWLILVDIVLLATIPAHGGLSLSGVAISIVVVSGGIFAWYVVKAVYGGTVKPEDGGNENTSDG